MDFVQASKGAYGIYSVCLVKSIIPAEWIDEFPMPTEREWAVMIEPEERRVFDIKLTQYKGVRQGWVHSKPSMCLFLLLNITESSEKRVMEQANAAWEKAKTDNDIVKIFTLQCDSHNFYGKQASQPGGASLNPPKARYVYLDKPRRFAEF